MIPKIIHYIWLGGNPKSKLIRMCIKSWKKYLPDFEIKEWNETNFNIDAYPYVKDAINKKKYAFAADYIRLKVLKDWGGVYLDTDVLLFTSISPLLNCSFFSGKEIFSDITKSQHLIDKNGNVDWNKAKNINGFGIMASIIGAEPNHPVIQELLRHYDSFKISSNGSFHNPILDGIMAKILYRYGLRYIDGFQELDNNIKIYPTSQFLSGKKLLIKDTYCIHLCDNSWNDYRKSIWMRIKLFSCLMLWKLQKFIS